MWAQLQKVSTKPDRDAELLDVFAQLRAIEQADSGLVRTLVMRSQADPAVVYVLVLFESEEKARAREQDPRREPGLKQIRAAMGDLLDGPPEFVDLDVLLDA
jgi:quinol monooxygenase YgiN